LKDIQAKNDAVLRTLRLKKVEWHILPGFYSNIRTFRITLSDGTTSPKFGKNVDLIESFVFPEDRPVRSVRVRTDKFKVTSLQFFDAANEVIK